jgi:hypothetical protein
MHMSQSLFYLTIALHVSGVTITHFQEHKITVTTVSGKRYTVIELNLLTKSTDRLDQNYNCWIMYILRKMQ